MQQIALITQPAVIKAMLKSVGLAAAPPERKRASLPDLAVLGEIGFDVFDQSVPAADD